MAPSAKHASSFPYGQRPIGVTSRLRRSPSTTRNAWAATGGVLDLPVIVDHVGRNVGTPPSSWWIDATVDLVDGEVALTHLVFDFPSGADVNGLQATFRWATPVEIVRYLVPTLLGRGIDPFTVDFATTGFPQAARPNESRQRELSDEFLSTVVDRYLSIGRGYGSVLALEYGVSKRTVVSWIEKARERKLLGTAGRGKVGGLRLGQGN